MNFLTRSDAHWLYGLFNDNFIQQCQARVREDRKVDKIVTKVRGSLAGRATCRHPECNVSLPRYVWGRPRVYCSNACRMRAYRLRVKFEREAQKEAAFRRRWGVAE